jgi:hypothetical protein
MIWLGVGGHAVFLIMPSLATSVGPDVFVSVWAGSRFYRTSATRGYTSAKTAWNKACARGRSGHGVCWPALSLNECQLTCRELANHSLQSVTDIAFRTHSPRRGFSGSMPKVRQSSSKGTAKLHMLYMSRDATIRTRIF